MSMIELEANRDSDICAAKLVQEVDPLQCKIELPFRAIFYPLGFAIEIITNAREVLDAADESWGHFRHNHIRPVLEVRIIITGKGSDDCPPAPVVRAQHNLMSIVADADNQAICDLKAGFASAWISPSVLQYRSYLRYHFIEAMVLLLLSTSYVTPIHAACVSRYGRGMLLCGDSGAGKSSLAYACACAGWTFTSDDSSYLVAGPDHPHIIGNSGKIRFRPTAKDLFSELEGYGLTPRAEGKPSIEIPTAELPGITAVDEAEIHCIIFLNRGPSSIAKLVPLSKESASQRFHRDLYPVEEIREMQAKTIRPLFTAEIYELRYRDLHHAVNRLDLLARNNGVGGDI